MRVPSSQRLAVVRRAGKHTSCSPTAWPQGHGDTGRGGGESGVGGWGEESGEKAGQEDGCGA